MSGDWKPGDVAMVLRKDAHASTEHLAIFTHRGWVCLGRTSCDGIPVRRLVVIDAEDAEQVERLASLLARFGAHRGRTQKVSEREGIARALRELDATPRIEEPQGLGAVVEDAQGHYWVRSDGAATRGTVWRFAGRLLAWRDLDVVRVLSEGVTP